MLLHPQAFVLARFQHPRPNFVTSTLWRAEQAAHGRVGGPKVAAAPAAQSAYVELMETPAFSHASQIAQQNRLGQDFCAVTGKRC